jgi:protein-disulfide isomerase
MYMKAWLLVGAGVLLLACGHTPLSPCVVPVDNSPTLGPDDAWVTLIEFADFECPYCASVVPTLSHLEADYPTELRLVFKHLPLSFHEHAWHAARAAVCAQAQGRFWDMFDLLYAHQAHLSDADLASYAAQLGLDTAAFGACVQDPATDQVIQKDGSLASQARISATPSFLVNGKRLVGAQPESDFRSLIDQALARALASGIAASDYYASLTASVDCNNP